ncbi:MAG: PIN domain-containing protein [Candidatus Pacearchaeota archaeon]
MKEAILDTSFILDCVRDKIDFFESLNHEGINPLIPEQVIGELEKVANSKKKEKFREDAKLALRIIEENEFEKPDIGRGHVDKMIKKFAEQNPKVMIASMDKELKDKVPNQKIVVRNNQHMDII